MIVTRLCFAAAVHVTLSSSDDLLRRDRVVFAVLGYGPAGCIWFGGFELLRHCVVRLVLAVTHRFPFASVRLLNDAVGLAFVRRAGSGYVFMHRMLLEHFAGLKARSRPALQQG